MLHDQYRVYFKTSASSLLEQKLCFPQVVSRLKAKLSWSKNRSP